MTKLTVLCWYWEQPGGRTKYLPEHVNTWAAMVRRNLTLDHEVACVASNADGIDPTIRLIEPPGDFMEITNPRWGNGRPQCYRRLSMFRPDAADIFGERIIAMDLDCVVGGPLDPLFDRPEDLVLFKGTLRGRPYNGSMMMIRAGCRPDVYEDFNQAAALESGRLFCGSDQAWLMHKLGPNEPVWDDADGVYWFGGAYRTRRDKVPPRVLFFPGNLKPWDVRKIDPFTREHYHLDLMEAA